MMPGVDQQLPEYKVVSVASLIPYVRNARTHSPACVDVAVRRWQDFTGHKAVLEGDGRTFDEVAT